MTSACSGMTRPRGMGICFEENMGGRAGMVGSALQLGERGKRSSLTTHPSPCLPLTYLSRQLCSRAGDSPVKLSTEGAQLPWLWHCALKNSPGEQAGGCVSQEQLWLAPATEPMGSL